MIEKIARTLSGLSYVTPKPMKTIKPLFDPNDSIPSFEENADHQVFSKDIGLPSSPPPEVTRVDSLNQERELGDMRDSRMIAQDLEPD